MQRRLSPRTLAFSAAAAAGLLAVVVMSALIAFAADTAPNGTYILRYLTGEGATFDTGETDNGYPATKAVIDDENRVMRRRSTEKSYRTGIHRAWRQRQI